MSESAPRTLDVTHCGFIAFRTPLLPIGTLVAWSEGLRAAGASDAELEAAIARDHALLEDRLRAIVADPDVREALFVASPSLDEAIEAWVANRKSERAHGVVEIVARYVGRMSSRATPFGLFSGCSIAKMGDDTQLLLAPRREYKRHTRLDTHYLSALCDGVEKSPALRARLRFYPSTGLFRAAGQLRYAESQTSEETRDRSYSLVSVETTPYLEATLSRAEAGKTPGELAQGLVDDDAEVALEEAAGYVDQLIDSQILVSDLAPTMTGAEPIDDVAETLRGADDAMASRVSGVARELEAMDREGLGLKQERYRSIASALADLPAKTELPRLFQVDLFKPAPGASFGGAPLREMMRALAALSRFKPDGSAGRLRKFRDAFRERYESRSVPLVDVLDDERGLGSELGIASSEPSPLLHELPFPAEPPPGPPYGAREEWLLRRLTDVGRAREWALGPADLAELEGKEPTTTPDAFAVMATIAAPSAQALARGEFKLHLYGVTGPSGANLLGRFCHGDDELTKLVEAHLRAEEALRPDAIFAEIVHLPEGRLGNILCRPVLRPYEIHYLGRGGAPKERRIALSDLRVALEGDRIVLRSERLGREIVPRLTSAHNFSSAALATYRFLCTLQSQDAGAMAGWSWGPLVSAPYLPRVTLGRTVLSLAQWTLRKEDIQPLAAGSPVARYRAVQALRRRLDLPRWITVADYDNVMPVDLDNVVHTESFAALLKQRTATRLREMFPDPAEMFATGPEGTFAHEVVVPFVRTKPRALPSGDRPPPRSAITRSFAPGSEWLYAKIFAGTATVDRVLSEVIGPVVEEALAAGDADTWFFVRYNDPHWHLRFRLHGDPARLAAKVLPRLHELAAPMLADGRAWKISLDTYDREVERYGGDGGMVACEEIFRADSEAVMKILRSVSGDGAADARWRLALRGMHALLVDVGLSLEERLSLLQSVRAGFASEHRVDGPFEKQLGARFRKERAEIEWLVQATVADAEAAAGEDEAGGRGALHPGFVALAERSRSYQAAAAELARLGKQGELVSGMRGVAASLLHMHANRLLRSEQRAHELVLYDFLMRIYEGEVARGKKKERRPLG